MKRFLLPLLALGALLPAPVIASTLIVPTFGNNSRQFNGTLAAARSSSLIAIINPNDGVGGKVIGKVASFSRKIQAAGSLSAGYINTNYGKRSLDAIRSDINKYSSSYGAKAIFMDEFSDSSADIGAYRNIYNSAKSKGMKVIGNPGTFVPKGYASVTDVLITYEDTFGAGYAKWNQKGWTKKYPKKKFGAIVNTTSNYQSVISRANSQNAEFIFATDGNEPSPYGNLPAYFSDLTAAVRGRGINAQSIPEPGSTSLLLGGLSLGLFTRRRTAIRR